MVKADVKRDYYADLSLSPNAETEAIKKQFRKLALKYHPDRNPGKEVEYIARFQAIQAAHEVLTDPQQRLKYDTDRLRAGYGKLYGPPKSDFPPRPQTNTKFPPPPRRAPTAAQPPRPPTGQYQAPPSTGAHRYASYARAGEPKWERPYDEAQTRADAFRGFQNMKPNANSSSGWSKFDPRTGQSSAYQATAESWARGNTMPSGQKQPRPQQQQGAYDPFGGAGPNQSFPSRAQSMKKKQGFAPGTPGGDEPMAKNTSAYVNATRERPQSAYFEPAPSPTAKKSPLRPQPATVDEDPRTPFERTSNRYATTGGEKTYFGRVGLDRSASVRNPTTKPSSPLPHTNPPSPVSPSDNRSRHHSASPKLRPDRSRPFSGSESSDTDGSRGSRPKVVPRSRLHSDKLKRGFFAQYSKNQDTGENFPTWSRTTPMPSESTPQPRNLFAERTRPDVTESSNHHTDSDQTQDRGNLSSKATPNRTNNMWSVPQVPKKHEGPPVNMPNLGPSRNPSETRGSMNNSMYGPSHNNTTKPSARKWSEQWGFSSPSPATSGASPAVAAPFWAYPSSVLPQHLFPLNDVKEGEMPIVTSTTTADMTGSFLHTSQKDLSSSLPFMTQRFQTMHADPVIRDSFNNPSAAYPNSNQQTTPLYGGESGMKSRSHESVNTTFSANDWNGKFQGSSEFFAPRPSSGDEHRTSRTTKASPSRGRTGRSRSASQSTSASGPPPIPTQPQPAMPRSQERATPFGEAKFSADRWAQELKHNTWTLPNNEARPHQQGATDRHSSPKKQPKATKQRTAVPQPAKVTTEVDEEEQTAYSAPEGELPARKEFNGGGGEAMDIDEDIPAGKGVPSASATNHGPTGEPRLVAVEPNNPEWRASARQTQQQRPNVPMNDTSSTKGVPSTNPLNTKPVNNLLNLSKFNNVAPFTTNKTGISDLNDLTTTLPFESRSGNTTTSARLTIRPGDLALPKPPKAPAPPKLPMDNYPLDPTQQHRPALTQKSWDRYVAEMGAYMNEWNAFNRKMLGHFNARQETVETGLAPRWISAVGDSTRLNLDAGFNSEIDPVSGAGKADGGVDNGETLVAGSGKGGYNAYLRGIDEDVVVRQHWDVASEKHRKCIIALGEMKDYIRSGGRLGR